MANPVNYYKQPELRAEYPERVKSERTKNLVAAVALAVLAGGTYVAIESFALPQATLIAPALFVVGAIIYIAAIALASKKVKQQLIKEEWEHPDVDQLPPWIAFANEQVTIELNNHVYTGEELEYFLAWIRTQKSIRFLTIQMPGQRALPAQFFVDLFKDVPKENLETIEIFGRYGLNRSCILGDYEGVLSVTGDDSSLIAPGQNHTLQSWADELSDTFPALRGGKKFRFVEFRVEGKGQEGWVNLELKQLPQGNGTLHVLSPTKKR